MLYDCILLKNIGSAHVQKIFKVSCCLAWNSFAAAPDNLLQRNSFTTKCHRSKLGFNEKYDGAAVWLLMNAFTIDQPVKSYMSRGWCI